MLREEGYNEEFNYDRMATLDLGRQENRKYPTDLKSSCADLPTGLHPCVKYKTWIFSLLMGSCLLATSGFSLYLGNVFPFEMDYLRCAAGSCVPSAIVHFASVKNRGSVLSNYQILFVTSFSITTTCLIWFGCKLAFNPSAININFNLILLILMEIVMALTVIVSARSNEDCCKTNRVGIYKSGLKRLKFPSRMLKSYSIVEVVLGISVMFAGLIALNIGVLVNSPYLYLSIFWMLAACFPTVIASHVAAEYPSKCMVEVLIATTGITSPLLFTSTAYLSLSIKKTINIFLIYPLDSPDIYFVLVLLLMLFQMIQAILAITTIIQCVHYKSLMLMQNSSLNISNMDKHEYKIIDVSSNTLRDFDKDKAWKTVMVQMAQ
ncbi:membrane protein MLC1 [Bombina bombina]|uniref:membrane protein MLC1 n=1 Tax=Bombina bombina TaxID=8345 RepID=UPI00235A5F33|nr:membrane protein MLC1 [Bombina bombina]